MSDFVIHLLAITPVALLIVAIGVADWIELGEQQRQQRPDDHRDEPT